MKHVVIRKAEQTDCPRLLGLVRELALYEKAPDEVTVTLSHFEESGFGNTPVWWAYVAELDGVIYGFALYYIRYSTWKGQLMYLEDIYIVPEMRGQGLGRLLFDQLVKEAKAKQLKGVVWQVLEWNESAIEFYKTYHARFDAEWMNCTLFFH